MYEGMRNERRYSMQSLSGQRSTSNLSAQSRTIAFIAILLFALAGLISGFTMRAFVRPGPQQQGHNPNPVVTPTIAGQFKTPVRTPRTSHPLPLGLPVVDQVQFSETSDGISSYTFSAHAIEKQTGQPIHNSSVTCKLWLTQDGNVNHNMPESRLKSINTLNQPFPEEVQNGLLFDLSAQQTQTCNNGRGTWTYKVSPLLADGTYYLVILTDWNGIHYNWSWREIKITK